MNKLHPLALVAFALVAGCGGSDPVQPPVTVASVTVSPSSATIAQPGETTQLTATVRGSDGSTMSTAVTWSTSAAGVATVSGSGLVTGVAAGTAAISAAAGGQSGSAVVTVNAPATACANAQTVTLAVGGSAVYDASACILLPSGSGGDRYRVAVYRPTAVENASDVTTVNLRVTGLGVSQVAAPAPVSVRTPASREPISGLSMESLQRALDIAGATSRAHMQFREVDRALQAAHGPSLLPSRDGGAFAALQRAASPAKMQLDPRTPSTCSSGAAQPVTALLIAENDDLAVYQDSTQHASTPVTGSQANIMLHYYSTYTKQMLADYFGVPSDIDGNGKLVLFVTPSISGNTAARVWSGDYYPQSQCSPSNEMEIMYFNNVLVQAMDEVDPSYQVLETIAHEAKHVVSIYHRVATANRLGSDQRHPSWLEEGTAEVAGEMSSRIAWAATGGPAVGVAVKRDHFVNTGITKENYGILLRMARTIWYLTSHPNSLVSEPTGAGANYSIYAPGWHFARWLGDGFGNASTAFADGPLFKQQTDSLSTPGVAGLGNITGLSYADMLEEYFTAIMLHGVGPAAAHPLTTYNLQSSTDVLASQPKGLYPWPVTERSTVSGVTTPAPFNTATYTGPIGASGVRIHDFLSNGSGTGAQIEVDAVSPAKILVVRIN